jgi:hypothetical protein
MSDMTSFAQELAARRRYVARVPGGGRRVGPAPPNSPPPTPSGAFCSGGRAAGAPVCMDGLLRNRSCDAVLGFQHAAAFVGHKNISKGSQHW